MSTKPSSHRRLRLILAAPAVPILLTAIVLGLRIPTGSDRVVGNAALPPDLVSTAELTPEVRQAGADESWWQAVTAELEREEYATKPTAQGLQAPNRAQNMRTIFGERGIEVLPRTKKDTAPAWRFAWQTTGFGRPGCIGEVSPSSPSSAGARVVYQRDGWSEWYENTAKGLEQGFTIERRPAGEGPLAIAGTFPAALHSRTREDGAVDFLDEHEACVIRYGELHVFDAKGADVPAELVVAENTLAIQIDDQGAAYPLVVDPLMTSPAWTTEGNQIAALFGTSVATAGDVNADGFSDVIVGAPGYDNGQEDEGRAYVFLGSAAGLATTPAWTAEINQAFGGFGQSVGAAGDVNGDGFGDVIVGAMFVLNGPNVQGAFVYHGSASGLAASPAWIAENGQTSASFGLSVGTAGDVNGDGFDDVIVGAPDFDNGQTDEGRAFVYQGSAAGLSASPAWTAECNQTSASFGYSVSTAGDVNADGFDDVIVGAWQYDNNNQPNQGRAFVYHGSAAGLSATAAWFGESGQQGANFGWSVANAGDLNGDGYADVIVGIPGYSNGQASEGRAYAYHGSAAGLGISPAWGIESGQVSAELGNAVATAGDVNGDGYSDVIIGAKLYDNGQNNEGRAFVFIGSTTGLATLATWFSEVDQGAYGSSVGSAGDVNGDGYSDVIVGAPNYANGQPAEGGAFVYHGAAAGLANVPAWITESNQIGALFGSSVTTAGDVNGDGFSDVIVGAPDFDNGETNEGQAFVFQGSAAGLSQTPAWTAESNL
ncbi:MAG TPA: integrin alpha, partial [Candidatus Udaeobacter sp.]|nr:integrin alpha [Candidatus Udaeobacter sp.]